MASMFRISTVFALGLLSMIVACSSDESANGEDASLSAEQACLKAHTNEGKFKFHGTHECQICGADRHEFQATLKSTNVIELPKPRVGLSFDLSLVAVRLTDHFGGFVELNRVAAGSSCGSSQSFQFDDDRAPTAIKLCNCDSSIKASGAAYVDLLVGCKGSADSGTATQGSDDPDGQGGATGTATTPASGGGGSAAVASTPKPTGTCSTGTCEPSCSDPEKCASHSSCSTGNCGSFGGIQISGGIQIGGSVQVGGGSTTTTTSGPTSNSSASAGGCSCLWNILFAANGCSKN